MISLLKIFRVNAKFEIAWSIETPGNTDLLFIRYIVSINSVSDLTILPWRIKKTGRCAGPR